MFRGRGEAAWQGGGDCDQRGPQTQLCVPVCPGNLNHRCWESLPQTAARDAVLVINLLR